MPTMCGEYKASLSPTGGGMHVSETEGTTCYSDGSSDQRTQRNWYESCIVFALTALIVGCSAVGGGVMGTYVHSPEGGGSVTIELKSDNRATVTIRAPDGEALPSAEGAWRQEGDQIITTMGTDQDVYTLQGDDLHIRGFGEDMVFRKR